MSFEITKYTPYNKGCLKGFFNITFTSISLRIFGCKYWCKEDNYWFSFPQEMEKSLDGKLVHKNIMSLATDENGRILKDKILKQLKSYEESNVRDTELPSNSCDSESPTSNGSFVF